MNITHIIDSAGLYGAERVLIEICTQQKKYGHKVNLVSIGNTCTQQKDIELSARKCSIDTYLFRTDRKYSLADIRALRNLIIELETEVVHSHSYKSNILISSMLNAPFGRVCTLHGYTGGSILDPIHIYELVDKVALLLLDKTISVAEETLPKFFSALIKRKHVIIPNGIDFSQPITKKPIDENPSKLVCIGRLSNEKNFSLAIDAMESLVKETPEISMNIFGEGPERNNLEKRIREKGLSEHITLRGFTNNIESALLEADLVINCSTTEGLPISLLECMRVRTNFIASNIKNTQKIIPEALKDEVLFELDKDELSRAIRSFLEKSGKRRQELAEALYYHGKENYSSPLMIDRYLHQYKSVLKIGDR